MAKYKCVVFNLSLPKKGLSISALIQSASRLNSVVRVRGCSLVHVRCTYAQAPRSPRFESGRRDFCIFQNYLPYCIRSNSITNLSSGTSGMSHEVNVAYSLKYPCISRSLTPLAISKIILLMSVSLGSSSNSTYS